MSRGLGIIQRKILDYFNSAYHKKYHKKYNAEGTQSVEFLCSWVFNCVDHEIGDPIRLEGGERYQTQVVTNSQYQSFCRALRKLQNNGMVKIDKIPCRNGSAYRNRDRHDQRGGQSYFKDVKCIVQSIPAMDSTLTTTNKCLVQNHLTLDSTLKNIQRYCND